MARRRLSEALEILTGLPEGEDLWGEVDEKKQWDPVQWGSFLKNPGFLEKMLTTYGVTCNKPVGNHRRDGPVEVTPGCTPLHTAAARGSEPCVKLLVEHKAKIDSTDDFGWSPLHAAVSFGNLETAKLLLDLGANINLPTSQENAARKVPARSCSLHLAVKLEDRKQTQLLIRRGASTARLRNSEGQSAKDLAQEASRGFWDFFDSEEETVAAKLVFLMATNNRVGYASSVRHLMHDKVFDPQVFRRIFEFVPTRVERYNRGF